MTRLITLSLLLLLTLVMSLSAQERSSTADEQPWGHQENRTDNEASGQKEPCRACDELAIPGTCRCFDFLTQEMAEEQYDFVLSSLADEIQLKRALQVEVISSPELDRMGGEHLLGLYEDDVIYLSYELRRRRALSVIAHEYGHAWMYQHRPDTHTLPDLLFEGFPEFLSYLVLRKAGDHEACYNISSVDQTVYGRGARRLIGLYYRSGLDAVLKLALTGRHIDSLSEQAY